MSPPRSRARAPAQPTVDLRPTARMPSVALLDASGPGGGERPRRAATVRGAERARPARGPAAVKTRVRPMTPGMSRASRIRAHLAAIVISAGLAGLACRAWALQVDDGEHYQELAARQHATTVEIPAPRGEVLDAHGRPLAVTADADSVWADPHEIHDVTATADRLAKLVDGDPAALEARLAGDRRFVWIARHVRPEVAAAVRAAELPGVEVAHEPRRWYPGRTLAGPVIGRADIDGNGLDGIELSMNQLLTGTRGEGRALRDARGRRMFADGMAQPAPGATVRLTLDRSLQAITEDALAEGVHTHQARSGVAVVLDVATGRVLAMASVPTYDPNRPAGVGAARNRAVTDTFEAGSVMKVFTVAAALEAGIVTPDTEFDVNMGVLMIPGRRIPIRDVHPEKYLTTTGIIKRSSNVGAAKIALRLGSQRLHDALLRFGFGARTQIELPGEQRGSIRPAARWRDTELATIGYGYGVTVTPLQLAAGIAAVGADGVYHPPRIIDVALGADGKPIDLGDRGAPRRVMSSRTAQQLRVMLATVFEGGKHNGTAHAVVVPGFRCGAKTGTANKYDPATRHYARDRYLASFLGLAPIDDPKLAIVVLIDEPSPDDHYGGSVAGPVFARIASEGLRYLGVPGTSLVCPPPTPGVSPALQIAPKTCVLPPPPAKRAAPAPVPVPVPDPLPEELASAPAPTNPTPDLRGMSLGRALDAARAAGLQVELTGSGVVVDQDPAPGAPLGARVTLRLAPRR